MSSSYLSKAIGNIHMSSTKEQLFNLVFKQEIKGNNLNKHCNGYSFTTLGNSISYKKSKRTIIKSTNKFNTVTKEYFEYFLDSSNPDKAIKHELPTKSSPKENTKENTKENNEVLTINPSLLTILTNLKDQSLDNPSNIKEVIKEFYNCDKVHFLKINKPLEKLLDYQNSSLSNIIKYGNYFYLPETKQKFGRHNTITNNIKKDQRALIFKNFKEFDIENSVYRLLYSNYLKLVNKIQRSDKFDKFDMYTKKATNVSVIKFYIEHKELVRNQLALNIKEILSVQNGVYLNDDDYKKLAKTVLSALPSSTSLNTAVYSTCSTLKDNPRFLYNSTNIKAFGIIKELPFLVKLSSTLSKVKNHIERINFCLYENSDKYYSDKKEDEYIPLNPKTIVSKLYHKTEQKIISSLMDTLSKKGINSVYVYDAIFIEGSSGSVINNIVKEHEYIQVQNLNKGLKEHQRISTPLFSGVKDSFCSMEFCSFSSFSSSELKDPANYRVILEQFIFRLLSTRYYKKRKSSGLESLLQVPRKLINKCSVSTDSCFNKVYLTIGKRKGVFKEHNCIKDIRLNVLKLIVLKRTLKAQKAQRTERTVLKESFKNVFGCFLVCYGMIWPLALRNCKGRQVEDLTPRQETRTNC
jgi:hypothetical protein